MTTFIQEYIKFDAETKLGYQLITYHDELATKRKKSKTSWSQLHQIQILKLKILTSLTL